MMTFQAKISFVLESLQNHNTEDALFPHFCRIKVIIIVISHHCQHQYHHHQQQQCDHDHHHPHPYHHRHDHDDDDHISVCERSTLHPLSLAQACPPVSCLLIIRYHLAS